MQIHLSKITVQNHLVFAQDLGELIANNSIIFLCELKDYIGVHLYTEPNDIHRFICKERPACTTHLLNVQERIVESKLAERQTNANSFKHLSSQSERFAAVNCMNTNLNMLTIKLLQLLKTKYNNHSNNNDKIK